MLAAVPADEMAETLCVLAGANAGNAARHFGRQSYASGDVASAIVWSSIAQTLELNTPAAREPEQEMPVHPIPKRMIRNLESAAFQGVRFEDVDAGILAQEEHSLSAAAKAKSGPYLRCVQSAAKRNARKVALPTVHVAKPTGEKRGPSRPVRSRVVKTDSRRVLTAA